MTVTPLLEVSIIKFFILCLFLFRPDPENLIGKKKDIWLPDFLNEWLVLFSIMGEAEKSGIIPRFAEELFTRIDSATLDEVSA